VTVGDPGIPEAIMTSDGTHKSENRGNPQLVSICLLRCYQPSSCFNFAASTCDFSSFTFGVDHGSVLRPL
jgi:hypothetical protein